MPHIKLEYTQNVPFPDGAKPLFAEIHRLVNSVAGVDIANCKSRLYKLENFWVGDAALGTTEKSTAGLAPGFVHLEVRFVEGRSIEIKNRLAEQLKQALLDFLVGVLDQFDLQVTVEVSDIILGEYAKYPAGSLTNQQG